MAAYSSNPGPSGGADLYSDAAPAAPEASEKEGADEGRTYTLPKEALAGKDFKPGEEIVFEIVRINDDSVEVKYASEGEEKSETPAEAPAPAAGGGEMTSMME